MKKAIIITLALITGLWSCKKTDSSNLPEATINISAPALHATFHKGDTLHIKALANYTLDLHGYNWKLTNTANGDLIASNNGHQHGSSITVDDYWVNTLSTTVDAKLVFTIVIDHEGNIKSAEVPILLQP